MRKVFGRYDAQLASPLAHAPPQVSADRLAFRKAAIIGCALIVLQASCRAVQFDRPEVSARRTAQSQQAPRPAPNRFPPAGGGRTPLANVQAPLSVAQRPLGATAPKQLLTAQARSAHGAPPTAEPRSRAREAVDRDVEETMLSQRLQLPPNLPGAQAPHLRLPAYDPENPGPRGHVIDKIFPDLPPVWPLDMPRPTPERPAMTLEQLQDLANQYNPLLIQARANVTSMEGDAINAGQHPNPIVGYESDTVGSSQSRDYQGIYVSQLVKTANKLNLARSAANVDVMNAQLAVRRTQMEVFARVKANYFAVLVAQENVIVTGALVRLADEVFKIQRSRLRTAGEAAGFEPGQLRGLADIAKTQLTSAENTYVAAWKALVAQLGLPNIPPMPLVGRADMPVPVVSYQAALARMLSVHPEILIGRNLVTRAQYALRLEEVTPIPDVVLYFTAQKDFTQPGARSTSYNSQVGLPLPIWNRNQGNIISARGDLGQARQQIRRAEMELTTRLANTFNQYSTNRITVQFYADKILPDYANAYRGVYELHQLAPEQMGFEGIIVAQTQLAQAIAGYIAALNLQWSAVADLSYLMQVETLEEMAALGGGREMPAPEPIPPPPPGGRPNLPGGRP